MLCGTGGILSSIGLGGSNASTSSSTCLDTVHAISLHALVLLW